MLLLFRAFSPPIHGQHVWETNLQRMLTLRQKSLHSFQNMIVLAGELPKGHVSQRCGGYGVVNSQGSHGREGTADTLHVAFQYVCTP